MFADVPLAKRVNHWIEWSGSGILLDIISAALSLLTVFTYMVGCTATCTVLWHHAMQTAVRLWAVHRDKKSTWWLFESQLAITPAMHLQVETHYSEYDPVWLSLRILDLVCSVIFAAEWCFWLWLSRNRIG
jgi:hypothetical protein